jgi:hypothetical protein
MIQTLKARMKHEAAEEEGELELMQAKMDEFDKQLAKIEAI